MRIYRRTYQHNFLFLFLILLFVINCKSPETGSATFKVFCAAGLSEFITEVKDSLKTREIIIQNNLASSGTLARQITQGNKCDIYISANSRWANYIDSLNLCDSLIPIATNKLAFIASKNSKIQSLEDIHSAKRIAMGNPAYVPVGDYTKQALDKLNIYNSLKGKIIFANDVKSTLRLVEMEECDAGFVYYSDVKTSDKVRLIEVVPDSLHIPIIFYLLKTGNNGIEVFDYLTSDESKFLLNKYGLETSIN